jgi:hypothetical protein
VKPLREIALPGMFDVPETVTIAPHQQTTESIDTTVQTFIVTVSRNNNGSLVTSTQPDTATFTGRVAAYFTARPNVWIDGRDLSRVGGAYAWRSRVSDCEYRYVVASEA